MLKIAVFGPIPSAKAAMTASENPGAFLSIRTAKRRSDHRALMMLARRHAYGQGTFGGICVIWRCRGGGQCSSSGRVRAGVGQSFGSADRVRHLRAVASA